TWSSSDSVHLFWAAVASRPCGETLQRIVVGFPAVMQSSVRSQLADCLVAVICHRLRFRADLKIRVPECEILVPSMPIKNFIRTGDFFRIISSLETGADHGMWTFQRYSTWLENKKNWHYATAGEAPDSEPAEAPAGPPKLMP